MKIIKNILLKPYPSLVNESLRYHLLISIVAGFIVFVILRIFQPFGFSFMGKDITLLTLGYGATCSVVVFIMTKIIPSIFNKYFGDANWKVLQEILYILFLLFMIGLANMFFTYLFVVNIILNLHNFLVFQLYTLAVGFFPVIFIVILNYNRLLTKNLKLAGNLNSSIEPP